MTKRGVGAAVTIAAAMLAGVHAHDPVTTRVTWNAEIARIVDARCVTCHKPGGKGPMSLATYDDARRWARAMKEEVLTRRMPKWSAVRGYGDFRNDPSLSPFEIALVAAWADGGTPRGTPIVEAASTKVPDRTQTPVEQIEERNVTLPCGNAALPEGRLLAVHPRTAADESVGMAVTFPDGRREIIGWIRDFDPDFATTYRLRTPIAIATGSTLTTEPASGCDVTVTLAP